MYVKIIDGAIAQYPYDTYALRLDNPNVSFPADEALIPFAQYNAFPVTATAKPAYDYTKNVSEADPELVNGVWTQVWEVTDATDAEKTERLGVQWDKIRKQRNHELVDTDWTQLPDAPITAEKKAEVVVFRQALRDVTSQANPFDITWPANPLVGA